MDLLLLTAGLGLTTGFLSGMLGIGGGIIMAPLLLYVPQIFGLAPLGMRVVAGLTIVQGLAACIAGALTHKQFNFVSNRLAAWMGSAIFIAALTGAVAAKFVANGILLAIFGGLAATAAILMLMNDREEDETPDGSALAFSRWRATVAAGTVGLLGGMVGQGGSFILIPLMTAFVKVPTRIAIGSNLAIVLLSTTAAFLGKAASNQIDWPLALPIVLTVIPATCLGSLVSRRTPVRILRRILAVLIGMAAIRIWISLLGY